MKKTLLAIAILCLSSMLFNAEAQETVCVSQELDGSITVRAWGSGSNKTDALEQARKQAVYDVIFKGITSGAEGYMSRPILNEPNARQKYRDYFDIFFLDRGEYMKYVSGVDKRRKGNIKKDSSRDLRYCITVRVMVPELRARLKADGVLK